ncbi:unnamed protein product [Pieris brassicae]|uniref:Uncharacterized protein n=1 Tax=Pieris brassicae TaxID=7116 RepID=A0A9P0TF56_PIEBR|nr:unnamed protein product [Pieris brassicae]
MAQVVGKKVVAGKDNVTRTTKILDVTDKNSKARSKSKIPKSVRYELENALVNLCDVWFDEIKPHLVRNKIKLHIHQDAAGDDEPKQLPQGAPGSSHLDPGESHLRQRQSASSAVCYPTQQAASTVRCHRPPQDPLLTPRHRLLALPPIQHPKHSEGNSKRRTRRRRKERKHTQSETRLRIPRLCNNFGLESKSNQVYQEPTRYQKNITNVKTNKTKMKSKYTQTESRGNLDAATMPKSPKPLQRPRAQKLQPNKNKSRAIESPFFKTDLVDIICSKHEDNLEVLFKSPTKSVVSSVLNLVPNSSKTCAKKKMIKPWK